MGVFTRVILFPFSWIYKAITQLRNHLYNIGYKKSFKFNTTVIGVGNLSLGGNGKTPVVEYLIRLLKPRRRLATLSRGYGRSTSGFRIATARDDAASIGDEPYQMFLKFQGEVTVAVGEERALAIPNILQEQPQTEVIILDDSFQHRGVEPQLNILVSDYNRPFFKDYVLPSGRLRESRSGAKRAQVVVVSKCPPNLSKDIEDQYREAVRKYAPLASIVFSTIDYSIPISVLNDEPWPESPNVVLVSGIANATNLERHVKEKYQLSQHLRFADHYKYQERDVLKITSELKEKGKSLVLLTTEKDMVKLKKFKNILEQVPFYYLPIAFRFLEGEDSFDEIVLNSMERVDDSDA